MNLSRLFILALIALSINQVKALAPCTGASTEIGGFVFRDYNANGVFDNSSNLQEVPMAGVTVSAYDDDDAPGAPTATATTDFLGTYLLTGLAPGTTYRLEFTWTFNWLKAGPAGGTTTQFAAAGSCNVDAAVNNPADYCDSDPLIFTSCYVEHNQLTGANANMDVLVGMPYSSGNVTAQLPGVDLPGHTTLAVAQELGTTYGLAYQRSSSSIFAGAYMKRHSGFGPDTTGAIYRYDMVNDTVTTFVDLNALFGPGTTGADPHPNSATGSTAWQRDANSWDPVGKISLGDLDISEDELFLWTINLADRKLYKIPLASATAPVPPDSAAQISRYPANGDLTTLTGLNCANNATDVRPFGLGIKDGFVYVGIVCSAESTGNAADLKATVFKFDPVAETFSKVLEFPLNYNRGFAVRQSSFSYTNAEWNPWVTTFTVHGPVWNSEYTYPQPMLSDIVFDGEDMILGFRDRFGDQMGHDQLHPVSGSTLYRGDTAGDLLRASPNGSGGWTIENNAQSNPAGAFGPSAGAGTGQGPGNGEFYYQDRFTVTGTRIHDEVILGGLLHIAGWPDVAATQFDPIDDANEAFDGGIFWMNDSLGTRSRAYRVFDGGGASGPTFGKSNGLGDLEAACDPAPIEIGNRVWDDADGDGIQDPSESGIPGVVVKLYKDTVLLDSTTTVGGGLYGFSSDSTGTTPGVKYGVYDLKPGMTYTLKIENYSVHPSIAGSGPTVADNGGSDAGADLRDNDAVANNGDAVITFTTVAAGDNNHNLDFGFGCPAVTLTFNVTKVSCPGETDGMIEVVVNSGLSPFDINWDNGAGTSGSVIDVPSPYTIDSLPVGDYNINVTDANGCLGTGVATVDNNPAPNPSLTSQSICFGDSATFDAGPGYASYFWSTLDTTQSITVSMQDTYFVAVTDSNGCIGVASATLVVHNLPTATIFGEFEVCPGDSLFLFASGGVSFLWNTGDTTEEIQKLAVNGAIYSVTVTDANGCTDTDSLQITVFPDPVVGISGNASICEGDSTTLTATGDGIDWFWSNGVNAQSITISPPSTSNYALTITDDNDCPASTSVTVFVNPQPVITILTPAECSPDLTTWSVLVQATNANQVTATSGVVQQMGLDTFLIHSIPSANSITVSALDTQTGCNASLFIANPGCNCPVILPPVSNGDTAICSGEPIPALSVSLAAGPFTADWYAAPAGGTPLATGTVLFVPAGAGTYYAETRDTLSGCVSDSRTPVTLTIHPNPTAAISGQTTICEGDSTTLTASGGTAYSWSTGATAAAITLSPSVNTSYTVTVTDGNGCTATATATVTVLPNTSSNISASICEGDSYQFGQQTLTQAGTYTQTFTAANGCDSVVNLTLTVLPVSNTNLSASICEGDSYQFGQQTLTQAGTYTQTFTAANGCDSVVNLTLTVLPLSNTNLSASICEGESYQFGQQILTQAGTYSQTFTAANGCDSVVSLTLTVLPVSNTNLSASICEGDSYQFGQQTLTQAGTYTQTFIATNGCDSVVNLTLTVLPVSNTNLSASICEGDSYQFGQQTLTQAGTYSQTFTAANGCDSVVNLTLTVLPVSNTNLSASICEGESYQFGQQTLTQAGTYSQTFTAANGCDSVVNLTLTVLPVSNTNLSASICEGDSYQFGQQTLTQGGTYSQTFTAANGCDSVVNLTLTVLPVSSTNLSASICEGDSYQFGQQTLTQAGTYTQTFTAANGCDSVVNLTLTVLPVSNTNLSASICEGDSYQFGQQTLTQAGTYSQTFIAANGCDSVVNLTLTVLPASSTNLSASICEGDSYQFGQQTLTQAGTYTQTFTAANGCDSVVNLILTVLPTPQISLDDKAVCPGNTTSLDAGAGFSAYAWSTGDSSQIISVGVGSYSVTVADANGCTATATANVFADSLLVTEIFATICEGEAYFFQGEKYTVTGVYTDTVLAQSGCDSILILDLEVLPTFFTPLFVEVCEGDAYFFGGQWLTQAGAYTDTLTASNGCDSVLSLTLRTIQGVEVQLHDQLCTGDTILFGSQLITGAGVYVDSLTAANGCDSIITLLVEEYPKAFTTLDASICQGEYYQFGTQILVQPGIYHDTLQTVDGCDSIITLTLEVLPVPTKSLKVTICEGGFYPFGNEILTQAGFYSDTLTAANGCDSIVTLELLVEPFVTEQLSAAICEGYSYDFNGQLLTQPGQYIDTLTAHSGCDSIVFLDLEVLPPVSTALKATICEGGFYPFGNEILTQAGFYSDTLTAANGCDSIVTLELLVQPFVTEQLSAAICEGDSYDFNGQLLTQPGQYIDTLTAHSGCDSIVFLNLEVLPPVSTALKATICEGGFYPFGNEILTQAGFYSDTLTAANGCDSIVTLELLVQPFVTEQLSAAICEGDSYDFNGQLLTQAGQYTDTLTAHSGCDSIVFLDLEVLPPVSTALKVTICEGGFYPFSNEILTQAGIYSDTLTAANGCDSIVTLELLVQPFVTEQLSASICEGDSYDFNGQLLTQSGQYIDTLTAHSGCDSIVFLDLEVLPPVSTALKVTICEGGFYPFGNEILTQAGFYSDTLTAANGCDSIVTLELLVQPFVTEQLSASICEGDSYDFNGQLLTQPGQYIDTLTAHSGCDSIVTLSLDVQTPTHTVAYDTICLGDSVLFFGNYLHLAGSYEQVLSTYQSGCDSLVAVLHLVVDSTCTLGPDLALNKMLAPGQPDSLDIGDEVTYHIQVFNQGTVSAHDLSVTDLIPTGMQLSPADTNGWVLLSPDSAVMFYPGPLAPGDTVTFPITLELLYAASGAHLVNYAEIGEVRDSTGTVFQDEDSTPANGNPHEDDLGVATVQTTPHDPTGYIYCDKTGKLIKGGSISVSGPGQVYIVADGSTGYYEFYTDGTPGVYTLSYSHPLGYPLSFDCLPQPDTLDPTGMANPVVLGSDTTGIWLTDPTCGANPYYLYFILEPGDPLVTNNNLPLACSQLGAGVCEDSNLNDTADVADLPWAGMQVWLFNCADSLSPIDSALTGADGKVLFDGLAGGDYRMYFDLPAGYRPVQGSLIGADGWSPCISLTFGQVDTSSTLCLYQCPSVNAGPDLMMCEGDTITLTGSLSHGSGSIAWEPSSGLSDPGSLITQAYPAAGQQYVLVYDDGLGCQASDTVFVDVQSAAIVLTYAPETMLTLECDQPLPWDPPVFDDGCGSGLSVSFDSLLTQQNCGYSLVRTWQAANDQGYSLAFSQVILVQDTQAPLIWGVPADTTLSCGSTVPTDIVFATDNCTPQPQLDYAETISNVGVCGYTLTRTWTATDSCGNQSVATQTIQFIDDEAPQLTFTHPLLAGLTHGDSLFMQCGEAEVFGAADAVATDGCSLPAVSFNEAGVVFGDCAQDGFIVKMICTWTATDQCGNKTVVTLNIFIKDDVEPVFTYVPANDTVQCGQPLPPLEDAVAVDGCDQAIITVTTDSIPTADGYDLVRNFTATDPCGNVAKAQQIIAVVGCPLTPTGIFENELVVFQGDCDFMNASTCLDIAYEDLDDYTFTMDGQPFDGPFSICEYHTVHYYTYVNLPGLGLSGPYQLQDWKVNGVSHSGTFNDPQELADLLNQLDPAGKWQLDEATFTIAGGESNSAYGPMEVLHLATGALSILDANSNTTPGRAGLDLPVGEHWLMATRKADGLTDSLHIMVACVYADYFEETVKLGQVDTICLDTSELMGEVVSLENVCQSATPGAELELLPQTLSGESWCLQCSATSTGTTSACYVLCDEYGICDTTYIELRVIAVPIAESDLNTGANDSLTTDDDELIIFNAFSPNGDGVNDVFRIIGLVRYPNHSLSIFNRWGNRIFRSENYRNDWKGTWNGTDLPDGSYFYLLDLGNGQVKSGVVVIRR